MTAPPTLRSLPALLLSHALLLFSTPGFAQESRMSDPRHSYDFGLHLDTFLPSGIRGVREIVPGWGARVSFPTSKGVFEFDSFIGRGSGISYNSASLNYRLDIVNDFFPVHFILGGHADYFKGTRGGTRTAGGWHYGGGTTLHIAGPILLRFDFQSRFSPGYTLFVSGGLVYRLPE